MAIGKCHVCGSKATVDHIPQFADSYRVECPRCSRFLIAGLEKRAFENPDAETKSLLPSLSAYIRQANERGEQVRLDEKWENYALAHRDTPITTKTIKLLELAASRSKPGHPAEFDPRFDPSLVDASDSNELAFLLKHLEEIGYLHEQADGSDSWRYILKAKGWEK